MKIKRPRNTKNKGFYEIFVYPEKGKFIGVCLTFDIVEEGKTLQGVLQAVQEAAHLHIEAVIKRNLSDDLLNRYAPLEYWKKYLEFQELSKKRQIERIIAEAIQQTYTRRLFNNPYAPRAT
jgi:predicted RNase H-like HicB family nuclease